MNRKHFLRIIGGSATGFVATRVFPGCSSIPLTEHTKEGGTHTVARKAFAGTSFVIIQPEGSRYPIYVRKLNDQSFSAVLLQCTHKGCEVTPYEDSLECPCHGSTYAPDGSVTASPATRDLTRFVVTSNAEAVFIHEQEITR